MEGIENFPDEEWKDIPGYEGQYKVSNYGRVYSFSKKRLLDGRTIRGHHVIVLNNKQMSLNKLVFTLFIHDTNKTVYNLDGNKYNHYYKNLCIRDCKSHIGEIINSKYTVVDVHHKGRGRYTYNIQCSRCNDIITITGNFNNITKRKQFKCSCYYKYNIGDKILDNYIIIDKCYSHEDNINIYKLQCQVCGDIIVRKVLSNSKHYFLCSCNKRNEYRVGEIYNGLLLLGKKKFNNTLYQIKCLKCGTIKWVHSMKLRDGANIRCMCNSYSILNDGRAKTRIYHVWHGIVSRCNNSKSYKDIFVCRFWHDYNNFKSWYNKQLKNYSLDKYDIPEWIFTKAKDNVGTKKFLSPSVDRIDPRFEYAPYNCQIIPGYINTIVKRNEDMNRSEKQLKIDELKFKRRKRNWIKEMVKEGYRKEDLI